MKIMHMMLSNFYIDGYNYQENAIPRQNKEDGHEVRIVASTFTFIDNCKIGYAEPSTYLNEDGIKVTRLSYRKFISPKVEHKVRAFPGVYKIIKEFSPDVIMFHGASGWELLTVAKYKKDHPNVKFYVDNHADFNNSASGFFSREILHKIFYKAIIQKSIPYIDKIFYLSFECGDFLRKMYLIPEEMLEFYPLGGNIVEGENHQQISDSIRDELSLENDDLLFAHSGKIDKLKRTVEILKAFKQVKNENFRLILIGTLSEDVKTEILNLIENDNRVQYLGWKNKEQLLGYLCAADMYVQPGGQSATMQNAICCGCPVMLFPHKSHEPYLKNNGFFVENIQDMADCFVKIGENPKMLKEMSGNSYHVAHKLLDYEKLAARLYE